jgi:hypothetical protein
MPTNSLVSRNPDGSSHSEIGGDNPCSRHLSGNTPVSDYRKRWFFQLGDGSAGIEGIFPQRADVQPTCNRSGEECEEYQSASYKESGPPRKKEITASKTYECSDYSCHRHSFDGLPF